MNLQFAHKTQRRVVLRPGNVVACVTACAGGTAVSTKCTVAKSAFKSTARLPGEEPVDVVPDGKSSTSDGYRLVVNNDKSAVMAFSDGEPWICREEKQGHAY